MKTKTTNNIELLLSKLGKQQLCEFIRKECAYDEQFAQRFLAIGAGTIFAPKVSDYQKRAKKILNSFAGRYGFVEYNETFALNRAICKILDEAEDAIIKQNWDVAIAVLDGIASVGNDIINCGDDSAGQLGCIIDECFYKWQELCDNNLLPENIKSKIFNIAISHFEEELLKGWGWWWNWLQMATPFADTIEKQNCIIQLLDNIINTPDDEWGIRYDKQTALNHKLEIISKFSSPEQQRQFMYENIDNPDFRRKLLQLAWDEKNHDEVLRLAKGGISNDSKFLGLVNEWRKWELKTYQHKNDKTNTLKLAQYFFFESKSYTKDDHSTKEMYDLMKSITPNDEWLDFVESLIKKASKNRDEFKILFLYAQEKMWDRYIKYLQTNPSIYNLDNAPLEVWTLYKDELILLYATCVKQFLEQASNRKAYCEGVKLLRKLIKHGGKIEANKIIEEQKARIPRRPALLDELSKL